jgi:hypothetical protein
MIPRPYKKYKINYISHEDSTHDYNGEAVYKGETAPSELGLYNKPLFLFEIVSQDKWPSHWRPLTWFAEEDIVEEVG